MVKYRKPEPPYKVETLPTMDIAMVIKPPLSLTRKNIVAYMVGYLLKKIPINEFNECKRQPVVQGISPSDIWRRVPDKPY